MNIRLAVASHQINPQLRAIRPPIIVRDLVQHIQSDPIVAHQIAQFGHVLVVGHGEVDRVVDAAVNNSQSVSHSYR